jgi:hypothetical protein
LRKVYADYFGTIHFGVDGSNGTCMVVTNGQLQNVMSCRKFMGYTEVIGNSVSGMATIQWKNCFSNTARQQH